jgi:hypothetical protein
MKMVYRRTTGLQLVYTIEADRHGTYTVRLGDKIMRAVYAPTDYLGRNRFGSKGKEAEAVKLAKIDIEQLIGMTEE